MPNSSKPAHPGIQPLHARNTAEAKLLVVRSDQSQTRLLLAPLFAVPKRNGCHHFPLLTNWPQPLESSATIPRLSNSAPRQPVPVPLELYPRSAGKVAANALRILQSALREDIWGRCISAPDLREDIREPTKGPNTLEARPWLLQPMPRAASVVITAAGVDSPSHASLTGFQKPPSGFCLQPVELRRVDCVRI